MKEAALYIVLALTPPGRRWVQVNETPLPRPAVSHIVAAQWKKERLARLVPVKG